MDANYEDRNGDESKQDGGPRLQPETQTNKYESKSGIHRMPYNAVNASIDNHMLSFFLMSNHCCSKCVCSEGNGDNAPSAKEQEHSDGGNEDGRRGEEVKMEDIH